MRSAKQAGYQLEAQMERWLKWAFADPRICRLRTHGRLDRGDIGNLYYMGEPVVIECKNTANGPNGRPRNIRAQFDEALYEAAVVGSDWPVLVKKRDGVTDRRWKAGGRQLAIIQRDTHRRLLDHLADDAEEWAAAIRVDDLHHHPTLVGMDCADLFRLFNHGLPLGGDDA
ncbi:hypothetical protein CS006_10505 [Bifidobacterium primatium]|uniref:Uncharacterized protein n=2 Tax=Bifidobacterium TaxID=1678 RepID=A0A2M9H6C7_9BIFI|nr:MULTISPECIES: hypothetical protein [Bifidobacterium]NEG95988.1 hypothetical protein [Bifidobacterium sp. SMB2]NEH12453.1 hypothetical protein [Bifidobacterium saimiriisciurei]PJM72358.1 hypothetical protein CS006_10505 [Bifidobacterium primatium]